MAKYLVEFFIDFLISGFCTRCEVELLNLSFWAVTSFVLLLVQGIDDVCVGSALVGLIVFCVL